MSKVLHHGELYSPQQYEQIKNFLLGSEARWSYTGRSLSNSKRFWCHPLSDDPFFAEESVSLIKSKSNVSGNLIRVYANGQTLRQDGSWHLDEPDYEGGTTVIWYLDDFDENCGGKTFFKHEGGLIEYVIPQKNKFISFSSKLLHKGESPNENFDGMRVTIAWKFSD